MALTLVVSVPFHPRACSEWYATQITFSLSIAFRSFVVYPRNTAQRNITKIPTPLETFANYKHFLLFTGLFVATFYHFYVHDQEGFVGTVLRKTLVIAKTVSSLDDKTFAYCLVSGFMQVMGILQMPQVWGPSFTPFGSAILSPFFDSNTWTVGKYQGAYAKQQKEQSTRSSPSSSEESSNLTATEATATTAEAAVATAATKKKRKKKKKTS